jgi:hypothetical protein
MSFYFWLACAPNTTSSSSEQLSIKNTIEVPWFHQLDIPDIGWAACSSASAAMVLAYHNIIELDNQSLIQAAQTTFSATSDPELGLLGRDIMAQFLMAEWGLSNVSFEYSSQELLYEIVRYEIDQNRPLILGTRSINSYGHYVVVTGYDGDDFSTASITINRSIWLVAGA